MHVPFLRNCMHVPFLRILSLLLSQSRIFNGWFSSHGSSHGFTESIMPERQTCGWKSRKSASKSSPSPHPCELNCDTFAGGCIWGLVPKTGGLQKSPRAPTPQSRISKTRKILKSELFNPWTWQSRRAVSRPLGRARSSFRIKKFGFKDSSFPRGPVASRPLLLHYK